MTRAKEKDYLAIAEGYAADVMSGRMPACQWAVKACRRQFDDLEKAKGGQFPYRFDHEKASRICRFIEMLPHIKGEWAKNGSRIELQPWQVFILTGVFGWVSRDTGLRRFRTVFLEMSRKNGKSTFSSGVGLYCLCLDGEEGSDVFSAATTRDQAKIVWQDAWHMVERSPGLKSTFGVSTTAHAISQIATASRFQALSAEGNSLDGLNIHCAIVDELHAHRTRKVYDVLETATGARSQPLISNITTAGLDRSGICYEQRSYVTKILDGVVDDPSYFGIIYTLDPEDSWQDEENWIKSNPNLDVSVDREELRRLALKAAKMPSALNNFLTKHMDIWVNANIGLFNVTKWNELANPLLKVEDFKDDEAWVGLDFAPIHDFTCRVILFRREHDDGAHYYVFARHFLSEGEIAESDNSSYSGWAREGWISTNPGNMTDDRELEDDVVALVEDGYQVQEVDCDPSRMQGVEKRIAERTGVEVVEILQNIRNLSAATDNLIALIEDGRIHHNGDPVLAWMLSNTTGHWDRGGRVYPGKDRPENKIDAVTALITALSRAMIGETSGSVYDSLEEVWV